MGVHQLEGRNFSGRHRPDVSEQLAISNQNEWSGRVYAICFDLEIAALKRHYPGNHHENAYDDICRELHHHGFARRQGSVYFGQRGTTPVQCVLAVQAITKRYSWFPQVCTRHSHVAD